MGVKVFGTYSLAKTQENHENPRLDENLKEYLPCSFTSRIP
jgi:hypothetical protein